VRSSNRDIAAGLLNGAAPAQAMPPLPLAPGDCQQWSFPGQVTIRRTTGELITFNSTGPGASGPAQWKHADGPTRQGSVAGAIDPSGQVNFSFIFAKDNTTADFSGKVGPDGKANAPRPPTSSGAAWPR
jgi:hypothetical protein